MCPQLIKSRNNKISIKPWRHVNLQYIYRWLSNIKLEKQMTLFEGCCYIHFSYNGFWNMRKISQKYARKSDASIGCGNPTLKGRFMKKDDGKMQRSASANFFAVSRKHSHTQLSLSLSLLHTHPHTLFLAFTLTYKYTEKD